ncbi:MAG: hypothetical protein ACYTJ0_18860 [Planctomycetota bacterium]|jgi:hypothetical protein
MSDIPDRYDMYVRISTTLGGCLAEHLRSDVQSAIMEALRICPIPRSPDKATRREIADEIVRHIRAHMEQWDFMCEEDPAIRWRRRDGRLFGLRLKDQPLLDVIGEAIRKRLLERIHKIVRRRLKTMTVQLMTAEEAAIELSHEYMSGMDEWVCREDGVDKHGNRVCRWYDIVNKQWDGVCNCQELESDRPTETR